MNRQAKINQLEKAVDYYLANEPDEYKLEAMKRAARRFMVSPKLLQRAIRILREEQEKCGKLKPGDLTPSGFLCNQ